METKNTTRTRKAVLICCANRHGFGPRMMVRDYQRGYLRNPEPNIRGCIMYCDVIARTSSPRGLRFSLAADRLRDFLTVRMLTAELDAMGAE